MTATLPPYLEGDLGMQHVGLAGNYELRINASWVTDSPEEPAIEIARKRRSTAATEHAY